MIEEIRYENGEKMMVWNGTLWKSKSVDEETKAFIEEYKEKYPEKNPPDYVDTYGEFFAIRYVPQLTKTSGRLDIRKVVDFVEGKDFICFDIMGKNGNAEIKMIRPFLYQNNNPKDAPDIKGSIPFEIFHRWIPENYDRMYAGWLLSAYNSVKYNEIKIHHGRDERAETPGVYIFVLMGSNNKPYACIAFEDIQALLIRLHKICPDPERWGIPDPDTLTPARERKYWDAYSIWDHYNKRSGGMAQNCWYVPFGSISDLATVTMINNIDPEKELKQAKYQCTPKVARDRYDYLKQIAEHDGRGGHFDPDAYTEDENRRIKNLEAEGHKVSKRNRFSISGEAAEKLQKGIMVTRKGEIFEKNHTEATDDEGKVHILLEEEEHQAER